MAIKLYQLYCEICNWKKITDGSDVDGFYEYSTSQLMGEIPKLENDKVVGAKFKDRNKKIRCPNCGRVLVIKKIEDDQSKIDDRQEIKERIDEFVNNVINKIIEDKE